MLKKGHVARIFDPKSESLAAEISLQHHEVRGEGEMRLVSTPLLMLSVGCWNNTKLKCFKRRAGIWTAELSEFVLVPLGPVHGV